jgi:hypothetical protein
VTADPITLRVVGQVQIAEEDQSQIAEVDQNPTRMVTTAVAVAVVVLHTSEDSVLLAEDSSHFPRRVLSSAILNTSARMWVTLLVLLFATQASKLTTMI